MLNKIAFKFMSKYLVGWLKNAESDELKLDVWGVLPRTPENIKTRTEQKEFYSQLYKEFLSLEKKASLGGGGADKVSTKSPEYQKRLRDLYSDFFKNNNFRILIEGSEGGTVGAELFNNGRVKDLVTMGIYLQQVRSAFVSMLSDKVDVEVDPSAFFSSNYSPGSDESSKDLANFARRAEDAKEAFEMILSRLNENNIKGDYLVQDQEMLENPEDYNAEVQAKVEPVIDSLSELALTLGEINKNRLLSFEVLSTVIGGFVRNYLQNDNPTNIGSNLGKNLAMSLGAKSGGQELADNLNHMGKVLMDMKAKGELENDPSSVSKATQMILSGLSKNAESFGDLGKLVNRSETIMQSSRNFKKVFVLISRLQLFKDKDKNRDVQDQLKNLFGDLNKDLESASLGTSYEDINYESIAPSIEIDGVTLTSKRNARDILNKQHGLDEEKANKFLKEEKEFSEMKDKFREERESALGGMKEIIENRREQDRIRGEFSRESVIQKYMNLIDSKSFNVQSLKVICSNPDSQRVLHDPVFLAKAKGTILKIVEGLLSKSTKNTEQQKLAYLNKVKQAYDSTINDLKQYSDMPESKNELAKILINLMKQVK